MGRRRVLVPQEAEHVPEVADGDTAFIEQQLHVLVIEHVRSNHQGYQRRYTESLTLMRQVLRKYAPADDPLWHDDEVQHELLSLADVLGSSRAALLEEMDTTMALLARCLMQQAGVSAQATAAALRLALPEPMAPVAAQLSLPLLLFPLVAAEEPTRAEAHA